MSRLLALLVVCAIVLAGCDLLPDALRPMLSEAQAVDVARQAAPERYRDADVLDVRRLTYAEVANDVAPIVEGDPPAPEDCVYHVNLGSNPGPLMGDGVFVVVDCFDGHVIRVTEWIS
jgi:hypothetical protein